MLLLSVFIEILLPILVLVCMGWALDRVFRLNLETLVKVNINVIVPAFIFVRLVTSELEGEMAVRVVAFTLCMIAAMFVLGELAGRAAGMGHSEKRSLQLATMFYNSGNFGLPLMALAYPVLGPVLQVFVLVTQNVATFTVGLFIASSAGGNRGWRTWVPVLRQWTLWGVALALVIRTTGIPITEWGWIWNPLVYLSNALVAVALLTIGVQLSQADHRGLFGRLSWALGIRLMAGPAAAAGLVFLFGFEGETAAILILGAGVPTAVNVAMLAHEFKADHRFLAAAVFYSTLLSMGTVTLIAALLRVVSGPSGF